MEYFKSSIIINKDTFREIRKYPKPPKEKIRVAIGSLLCFATAIIYFIVFQNTTIPMIGLMAGVAIPLIYIRQYNHVTKVNFARLQESIGASEFERSTSFTDEKIKIHDETGNTAYFDYDVIRRFAETKDTYALITKENQVILVSKIVFTQEQRKEFIHFIKRKCKNVNRIK